MSPFNLLVDQVKDHLDLMPGTGSKAIRAHAARTELPFLRALILARIACAKGAGRATIAAALEPLTAPVLSAAALRERVKAEVTALWREGLVSEAKPGRLTATPAGREAVDFFLGSPWPEEISWEKQRDVRLLAKATGRTARSGRTAVTLPDLRLKLIEESFGLPLHGELTPTRLRTALAYAALERAFGPEFLKSPKGPSGRQFSAAFARQLAARVLRTPRPVASDAQLFSALAAECAGVSRPTPAALRKALLRNFTVRGLSKEGILPSENKMSPVSVAPPAPAVPDLETFASQVKKVAQSRAQGWLQKAFISHVWNDIRTLFPEWELSEAQFKDMLTSAHRAGRLRLATADLRENRDEQDIAASKTLDRNTVWHYIRVES